MEGLRIVSPQGTKVISEGRSADESLRDDPQKVIEECREKPLRQSEIICSAWGIPIQKNK